MRISIQVEEPFKNVGEQLDGAIKHDGAYYLIELKWFAEKNRNTGLTKAEVPVLVTDDEVIEQWPVEHVGGGAESQREPRIVRARCRRHARWGIVRGGDHPAELKCLLCYSQPGCLTLA